MIKSEKLIDREFIAKIKKLVEEIISENDFRSAYNLSKELTVSIDAIKNYKRDYRDLYNDYQRIIIILRWVGLNILAEDKVTEMFKHNFVEIFEIPNFDLWEKLKTVLLSIILLEPRDKYKKQLIQALLDNQQNITSRNIIIDNLPKEPTVSNWLLDYNKVLGTGEVSGLARTEYLVNGKNIRNLNERERQKVRVLFDLYERLKLSSLTFEGLEEDIPIDDPGKEGIIRNGVFEPLAKMDKKQQLIWDIAGEVARGREKKDMPGAEIDQIKTVSAVKTNEVDNALSELKNLAAQYPAGSLERKAVEEEMEKEVRSKK